MIFDFLFSGYRALEAQLQEATSARITAEDRVREYRAKYESAEEKWQAERDRNDYLSRAVMDHQAISAGHLPIFGVVPTPPPSEEFEQQRGGPSRRLAREALSERNAAIRRKAFETAMASADWQGMPNPGSEPSN